MATHPIALKMFTFREFVPYLKRSATVYAVEDDGNIFKRFESMEKNAAWNAIEERAKLLLADGYDVDFPSGTPEDLINRVKKASGAVRVNII